MNGFVLPSPRIEEYDNRDAWEPKLAASGQRFVLCQGDLSRDESAATETTLVKRAKHSCLADGGRENDETRQVTIAPS